MSSTDTAIPISLKKATIADIDSLWHVMKTVDEEVADSNIFIADNKEYIASHIEEQGYTFLAQVSNALAGFLIIDIPKLSSRNLGYDLSLSPCVLQKSVHIDSVAVLTAYRGFGLQKKLITYAEKEMEDKGFTSFLATVSPLNLQSLNNFLRLHYCIGVTKRKYHGVLRHVLHKYINKRNSS